MMGGDPKSAVEHGYIVNRDPELASAWTKHKAVTNHENFHNINVDLKRDHITPIETIANSALEIEGWALHDVGLMEPRLLHIHRLLHLRLVQALHPRDAPDRIYDCMVRL